MLTELTAGMHDLRGLRWRPVAPEERDVRYRLLRVIRSGLEGKVPRAEIDRQIDSLPHAGLRLDVDSPARVVGALALAAE